MTLRFFKHSKFLTRFLRYRVRSSLVLLVAYFMISRDNLAALQVRSSPVLLLAHFMVSPAALPIPYCVSLGGPQLAIQFSEASHNVFPFDVRWLALNKGFVALLLILSHAVNLVECWKYSRGPCFFKGNVLRSLNASVHCKRSNLFHSSAFKIQSHYRDLVFPTGGRACYGLP